MIVCSALHEPFSLATDDEDITDIRLTFLSLVVQNDRAFMRAINSHLPLIITRYANTHTVETFKERTAFVNDSGSDCSPDSKTSSVSEWTDSFS